MGEVKIDISDLDDEIGVSIIKSWFENNTQNILGDKGSPWRKFCAFIGGQIFPDLDSINDLPTAYHKCVTLSPRLPKGTGVWIEKPDWLTSVTTDLIDLARYVKMLIREREIHNLPVLDSRNRDEVRKTADYLLAQLSPQPEAREEQVSLGEVKIDLARAKTFPKEIDYLLRHGFNGLKGWLPESQAIFDSLADQIAEQITPPVELPEPKEFGAVVEAGWNDECVVPEHRNDRFKWIRVCRANVRVDEDEFFWQNEHGYSARSWSDLINPRVIGGEK